MAMSNANLERRVERNTSDIEAMYDMLTDHGEQPADHGRRLADIQSTLSKHDTRFDRIDSTLSEVLDRLPEPGVD